MPATGGAANNPTGDSRAVSRTDDASRPGMYIQVA